jgi:predicted nucleic acid-binding OB-fold protein
MEVNMTKRDAILAIAFAMATLASSHPPLAAEQGDQALVKAIGDAKLSLLQGIAQVAKGTEVPIEAKYEMEDGKLMLSVYTSAKGFDTAAEDNSFNEYKGDVTTPAWAPKKEVFADLKHIARSAQYHALLSMTKTSIPTIIQKASAQGTVLSVKEKIRGGKPVFEVMIVQGGTIKPAFYDLVTGEPTAS